jgi:hypothetical protein
MSNHQHGDDRADVDELRDRLDAVERTLTDGADDLDGLQAAADAAGTIEDLQDRVAEMEDRIAELDAATQAIRGYVGSVRSVNRDVERRADAALAKVEALEAELDVTPDAGQETATDAGKPPESVNDRCSGKSPECDSPASGRATDADPVRKSCRCAHCGARRDDSGENTGDDHRGARAASVHRDRDGVDEPTAEGRPTADGGHDEWARETARARGESADSDDGFLSGLRNAL